MINQPHLSFTRNNLIIQLIILFEGFVTISFEILTIRQLIPLVGNSVVVTSLIIGVFLLFLAYGYRKGGIYTDNYIYILKYNFCIAAFGIGIGLSYIFIKVFFLLGAKFLTSNALIILLFYLLVVTAPLVYLLGQTVPITLNLCKQQKSVGALGGQVLHISTLGSFLGAVLTSLLLMNYLGVAWTVFINYLVLTFLVLLLIELPKEIISFTVILFIGVLAFLANIIMERNFFVLTNSYNNYQVISNPTDRVLFTNDSASSAISNQLQGFPYIEYIKKILFVDLNLHDKTILVLGAGGFTLSAADTRNNHFTYVDVDPQIRSVVQQHFLAPINGKFVAADAREFLNRVLTHYDVVVADTYSNEIAIPAHLLTQEYFAEIYRVLKPDGLAVFNIIARPTLADAYSKRIDNTIRSVFKNCMVVPLQYTEHPANIIYICKKTTNKHENELYTDNMNKATLDFYNFN